METTRPTTVIHIQEAQDAINGSRTELVRLPQGANDAIFGGWGVRI